MLWKKYYSMLVLRIIVIISAITGTFLSAYAGRDSFMGGKSVFMYFTIQSNIALAIMVFLILVGSVYLILLDRICKARNSK